MLNRTLPPFKKIKVECTLGWITRDDLISDWVIVTLDDGSTVKAYYHFHHRWMIEGVPEGLFKYGYVPLNKNVITWTSQIQ